MRIIYFDLDCLRPDHLGCYGYSRNTSPNIDKISQDGMKFNRCYTSNSPCLPSRAALFSGRFGINTGVIGHHPPSDIFRYPGCSHTHFEDMPMVMRYLRREGNLKTISFSNFADRHTAWWFHAGWAEYHTISLKMGGETADEVNSAVLPWLKEHCTEDNYFLHIHYWDIHSPYRIPDIRRWMDIFKDAPAPDWPDEKTIKYQYENMYGPRTPRDLFTGYHKDERPPSLTHMPEKISTRDEFKLLIDGYDASIYYVDYHIGKILDLLKDKGTFEETVFIISCDHGENFGEGGHYMDHTLANETIHRLPLIIRWPGITQKISCDALIYQLDLAPTLCEILNIPIPAKWDGISFADALKGKNFESRKYLVFDHGIYTLQRAVRTRNYLFVRTYHPGLYSIDEPCSLFDMNKDSHMTTNIVKDCPEIVKENNELLTTWWHEQVPKHSPHPDPMEVMVNTGPFLYYKPEQMIARLRKRSWNKQADELIKQLLKYQNTLCLQEEH